MAGMREAGEVVRRRARSEDDKRVVREAFVAAGRKLFARGEPGAVSLRAIAAEAGYSPGAIYAYFQDQHELFACIREHEIERAWLALSTQVASVKKPRERLIHLLGATADYWAERIDDFLLVFPRPTPGQHAAAATALPFAQTPVMRKMLGLYEQTVAAYFDTLPRAPMHAGIATDMLIASVHGTLMIPCMARTKTWSCSRAMVRQLVGAIVDGWERQLHIPYAAPRRKAAGDAPIARAKALLKADSER